MTVHTITRIRARTALGWLQPHRAALSRWLVTAHAWVSAFSPSTLLSWVRRHKLITFLVTTFTVIMTNGMAHAFADPGTGENTTADGDPFIAWMGIKDTHNVPVAKYTLTLNQGGWNDPTATIFFYIDSVIYETYLCITTTALWLIKFVLDFEWLKLFTVPFQTIGNGVNAAVEKYGLAPTALAVLAFIAVFTFLSGKAAKAMSQIGMALVITGVAASIFANPLSEMIGPDGLLAKGRDTGLEIAVSLSGGTLPAHGAKVDPNAIVSQLADRFLRSPTQMINFGMVSDSISRKCEEAWSNGIIGGHGDKLKDDIKGCGEKKNEKKESKKAHKKSMDNPASILVGLILIQTLSFFLVAFACYFAWHVVRTAVQALLFAALAPPAFLLAVIPGGPQTFALKTVLDCAMAYLAMIIFTAAFGGYNVILDRVFVEAGANAVRAIFMTSLVLAIGFAFFGPLRRMFDRTRDSLAAKISGGAQAGGKSSSLRSSLNSADNARRWLKEHTGTTTAPPRQARRINSESPSETSNENVPAASTSEQAAVETTVQSEGQGASITSSEDAPAYSTQQSTQSSPAVNLIEWSGHNDRLATAQRLADARAASSSGPQLYVPPGSAQRYSLSEAA